MTEKLTNTVIAKRLHISLSAVQRQLEQFIFKEPFSKLPEVLSWDEFDRAKDKFAFIAQNFDIKKSLLGNSRQTTIKKHFTSISEKSVKPSKS